MKGNKFSTSVIVLTGLIILGVGFNAYERAMSRRGGIALHQFQTLSELIIARTRLVAMEATGAAAESTVIAGSGSSQTVNQAELDYQWEILPTGLDAATEDLPALIHQLESELTRLVDYHQQVLRVYYPQVKLQIAVSQTDSAFFHKSAILVSVRCAT